MKPPEGRAARALASRYREELRRLSLYWPAESVTLEQALAGRSRVRLHGGQEHQFSRDELERLASQVPPYLRGLVRLPLLLRYEAIGSTRRYRVLGGPWQRRLAEIMLRGTYTYTGLETLRVSEFQRIAARYGSLVFVGLTI